MRMNKLREEIKYWSQLFLMPLYGLSFLMPRNKKVWVFGSTFGHHFADNPKYFFLYLRQLKVDEVRPIWITRKKEILRLLQENELEVYLATSLKGIWYSLRAKVYFYDNYTKDINFWLSGSAVKINLWHGIPLKKINMDNKFDPVRNPVSNRSKLKYALRRLSDEKPSHYVLTTSDFLVPIFSSAFATKKVLCCGYPRNEILGTSSIGNVLSEHEKYILARIQEARLTDEQRKIILYMPTFRDSEVDFFETLDRDILEDILKRSHMILLIKPHLKSKFKKEYEKLACDTIWVVDGDADPYVFLKDTDALITDYSSIYFDYLLLDKPIIFFCYDLKEYQSYSREMYYDYHEFTPGIKVYSMEELMRALSDYRSLEEDEVTRGTRLKLRSKLFVDDNQNACEKLYREVEKILEGMENDKLI